jgi:NAD(P)-dependent dehydrogenase (short-subunit alcohol dehydrogenase family)
MSTHLNKVALVTGGTSGIGRAAAIAFGKAGAKVIVAGRRIEEGARTVALIEAAGGAGAFVRCDVTRESDIQAMIERVLQLHGRLDIAFNNAGVEIVIPVTDITEQQYRQCFDVNVLGTLLCLKHEIPAMLRSGGGAIVNMSSVAGLVGMLGTSIYGAAKHAIIGMTQSTALECAKQNIRVNAVAPAAIETDMLERFVGGRDSETWKYYAALHPIGRMGRPEEVAAAVLWLCGDEASFVTGQTLAVDGGYTVP